MSGTGSSRRVRPGPRQPGEGEGVRVDPAISGCKHVQFTAPGVDGSDSRNAMAIHPGWFDRSPCGTGTSARLAQLHARGELELGVDFVNESLPGTGFTGRRA